MQQKLGVEWKRESGEELQKMRQGWNLGSDIAGRRFGKKHGYLVQTEGKKRKRCEAKTKGKKSKYIYRRK